MRSTETHDKRYYKTPICPWMNKHILEQIKKKDFWHSKVKMHKNNDYYLQQFRLARNKVTSLIRVRKKEYYTNLIIKNSGNSRITWRIINSILRPPANSYTMPDFEALGVSVSTLVLTFNAYFCTVGSRLMATAINEQYITYPPRNPNTFKFTDITASEIVTVVSAMPVKFSVGCDNIPSLALKECIDILCVPLEKIFNLSFYTSTYPDLLKLSKIIPIHKAGDKNIPENYRPISILSTINIVFEKLIVRRIMSFLEGQSILTPCQHGFRKGRSTDTAVLSLSELINFHLNNNRTVVGIFLDIKKAFDTVNHSILLNKLECYGFRGMCLEFFKSYLENRKQAVQVADTRSEFLETTVGIPQGSVLGPIFFSLYINDLPCVVKNFSIFMYADDTALICAQDSPYHTFICANSELNDIHKWFSSNKLTLNTQKTKYIVFNSPRKLLQEHSRTLTLNNSALERVNTIKYLGVILDESFNWKPHIDEVCKKLSKACFLLHKCRNIFDIPTLRIIYFSIFHSHLNYCLVTWGHTYRTYLEPVIILQKRAIRFITNSDYTAHTLPLFRSLNIMPFTILIDYRTALMVQASISTNYPVSSSQFLCSRYESRNKVKGNYLTQQTKNIYGNRKLAANGVAVWNNLPLEIKQSRNFSLALKRHFLSNI